MVLINPMDCYTPEFTMPNTIPTQLLILATYLKKNNNIDIEILDLSHKYKLKNRDVMISKYLDQYHNWPFFGITCFTSNYYLDTIFLAKKIREINPDALIFVGGYHPTIRPNDFIFPNSPFDFIFSGEAEIEINKLMEKLRKSNFKKPNEPTIIYCSPLDKKDFINVDWSYVESFNFIKNPQLNNLVMFPVFLSRGCPFLCRFCQDSENELTLCYRKWRRMPIIKALKELKNIGRKFLKKDELNYEIMIFDPLFGTPTYRVKLYKKLLKYAPNQNYWAELRVDTFKPEKEIPDLKQLKFSLSFGFESGSAEMLRIMNKTQIPDKYLENMKNIANKLDENEIYYVLNLLFGHPGETYKTFQETYNFLKDLVRNKQFIIPSYSKYMLYTGTEIYSKMSKYENLYGTEFLIKKWWVKKINQMRASKLVNPSKELDCIDMHYKIQEIALDLSKSLRKRLGKRSDMFLIYSKFKQHFLEDMIIWKNAPQLFINFIRDNVQILLDKGHSNEMHNFIKNNVNRLLTKDTPLKFTEFIHKKFPEFL